MAMTNKSVFVAAPDPQERLRELTEEPCLSVLVTDSHIHRMVDDVCQIAGDRDFVDAMRREMVEFGIAAAVQTHTDGPLFDWLMAAFSYQGVSNAVASAYLESGGGVDDAAVVAGLRRGSCPRLRSYWAFEGCGYRKHSWACAEPDHRLGCALSRHDLRNGRLNQTAYSLRLFMRDICGSDLVGWIDQRLEEADHWARFDRTYRLGRAVIEPFKGVFGVSDKVLSMAFSDLMIGADPARPLWVEAGGGMIAIDTLVHNWLLRTGVLATLKAEHPYGPGCYAAAGCEAILRHLAAGIEARKYNPDHPPNFPRFVQHAVWRFCARDHVNRCNGAQIDDRAPCKHGDCPLHSSCAHIPLHPQPSRNHSGATAGGRHD